MTSTPTPESLMNLSRVFWESKTLMSAVELEIFTTLASQPLDAETLQTRLRFHHPGTRDLLETLVALGLLERDQGTYANTPHTNLFLDKAKPTYIGNFLEKEIGNFLKRAYAQLYPYWSFPTKDRKPAAPSTKAKKEGDLFRAKYADTDGFKSYLQSMTGLGLGASKAISTSFPWEKYQTYIDIGAGQGGLVAQVALAHPHLTGGGFDLPRFDRLFWEYMHSFNLQHRLKFFPGNFFEDSFPKADVLSMGHIPHDWNLEEKKLLIHRSYESLPHDGALILFESLIDDEQRSNAFGLFKGLKMVNEALGGFDYTGEDCTGWLKEAGFRETRVEHLVGADSMVIGIK